MNENPDTFLPFSDSLRMVKKIDAVRSAVSKFCVCLKEVFYICTRCDCFGYALDMVPVSCSNGEIPNYLTACLNAVMRQIYLGGIWPRQSIKSEFSFTRIALVDDIIGSCG